MAVAGKTGTRRRAVIEWLHDNPGYHRPVEVAAALGLNAHDVAATCIGLSDLGSILRRRVTRNKSVYAWPEGQPLPDND